MAEFDLLSNDADMAHAIRTYSQQIRLKCAYTVDPITQEATNILDSFVPLRVLEGDQVADLLKQTVDLDKQVRVVARTHCARTSPSLAHLSHSPHTRPSHPPRTHPG